MRFATEFSFWWIVPIAFIALFLSVWYYRGQKWLKESPKLVGPAVIGLRALSLIGLAILLLGIIFQSINIKNEKPILLVGVDNSSSMLNYSDSLQIPKKVADQIEKLKNEVSDKMDVVPFVFGDNFRGSDSISFLDLKTNISDAFNSIHSSYYNRNLGGIVIYSDGNFNTGTNPIYAADKIPYAPIFTVGVGDTLQKRDHFIKSVLVNDVAFLNNTFPIQVDLQGVKMGKGKSYLSLIKGGKVIKKELIEYTDGELDFVQVVMNIDATSVGFQQYELQLQNENNEVSYLNNRRSFYIEVIDSRSKVILLTEGPHPDIAAIKSVLDADQNIEVVSTTIEEWDGKLEGVGLVVWHGAGSTDNPKTNALIASKTPLLSVITLSSRNDIVARIGGVTIPRSTQIDQVQGALNKGFLEFELSQDFEQALGYFPPLQSRFGSFNPPKGATVFLKQRIGPVVKNDPLIFFSKTNNRKQGYIYGEGIWKWKLTEYRKTKENIAFNELIQKITQYLTVKENTEALRVTLPKKFIYGEDVIVNASLYNSSMEPVENAKINFSIKSEFGESKLQFASLGSSYKLNLGKLKPGKYEWEANTIYNKLTSKKVGVFIVEDISLEALDTRANHALLNQIAVNSGGQFYSLNKAEAISNSILLRDDITTIAYEESSFNDLIDYLWILLVVLFCLGGEWFIRRYFGSY